MIKKKDSSFQRWKKSLIIPLFFIQKNIFCKSSFKIYYTLEKKIIAIILVNTCITNSSFIDEKFVTISKN